jgi:hypothetical protein
MTMTRLQKAFTQWRAGADIGSVASEFRQATLFVACKQTSADETPVFYLTRSRNPERVCVTVSEDAVKLAQLPEIALPRMTGAALLQRLGPLQEVIVVYEEGGDLLTAEQLAWMRRNA